MRIPRADAEKQIGNAAPHPAPAPASSFSGGRVNISSGSYFSLGHFCCPFPVPWGFLFLILFFCLGPVLQLMGQIE